MRGRIASYSIAFMVACGGRTEIDAGLASDAATIETATVDASTVDVARASVDGSLDATNADAREAEANGGAEDAFPAQEFRGVVLLRWAPGSAAPYQAYADFAAGPPVGLTCPTSPGNTGGCCCEDGVPLPGPTPSAGILQLSRLTGQGVLVLLQPSTTYLQGTSDLGPSWYVYPGIYDYTDSGVWLPCDGIAVAGGGADLLGFEGTLHTGAALTGVVPPIGPDASVVDRSQDFHLSWAPEGLAGEELLLTVRQITSDGVTACFCSAPDSAGELTVDTSILAMFAVEQLSGTIEIERVIVSTVTGDDAVIDLVGAVAQEADVTFE
jgi:hypothetical protein